MTMTDGGQESGAGGGGGGGPPAGATATPPPNAGGKVTPTPGQKEVNISTVCRIGQETVEEIVSRTQEVFSILKSLHPPVGGYNKMSQMQDQSQIEKQNGHSQGLKVVKLGGQTNGLAIDKHEVTLLAVNLVNLEDTLLEHGGFEAAEQVLSETQRPTEAGSVGDRGVLVHETVDLGQGRVHLDVLSAENRGDGACARTDTLGLLDLHCGERRNLGQEVANGRKVLALALGHVLEQLARGNIGVGLEGQVVVGELLVVALDGLEELVGGFLNLDR